MNPEIQAIISRYDLPNNILLGDLRAYLTGDELARVHYLLKYPNEKTEPKGGRMKLSNKHKMLLDKIIEWLEQELAEGQEVIDEYQGDLRPKCTDGSDDIIEGRVESANALLEQIRKWEASNE